MDRQVVEIIDELVEIATKIRHGSLCLHVNEESPEIAHTICDANPRAKNKSHALSGN
jgi:recombinational DNA repair protein RecR